MFTSHIAIKELTSRILRCLKFKNKSSNHIGFKNGNGFEQTFAKENIQVANKHMKRWPTLLVLGNPRHNTKRGVLFPHKLRW